MLGRRYNHIMLGRRCVVRTEMYCKDRAKLFVLKGCSFILRTDT